MSNILKDEVIQKLDNIYGEEGSSPNPSAFANLLHLLDKQDQECRQKGSSEFTSRWFTLRRLKGSVLKHYVDSLLKEAGTENSMSEEVQIKDKWKMDIYSKLEGVYGDEGTDPNPKALASLMCFLDHTDHLGMQQEGSDYTSPFWKKLITATGSAFKIYAELLLKDAQECEKDPSYLQKIIQIYQQMSDSTLAIPSGGALKENVLNNSGKWLGVTTGAVKFWHTLSPATQTEVLNVVRGLIANKQVASLVGKSVDDFVSLVNKGSGNVVMVTLAALSIGYAAYKNIRDWWNGKISGKRCAKNVVDHIAEVAGGIGGGFAGAAAGSMVFPGIGTLVGGVLGGWVGSAAAQSLCDSITTWLFGLPKSVALENAYNFIGVHHTASNLELNRAFRKKALLYHPDKGGNAEKFHELQINFAVIKASKGEIC